MITTVKFMSNSVGLATGSSNTIFGNKSIYISNASTAAEALITVANSTGGTLSTFAVPPRSFISVIKAPTDTLTTNTAAGAVFASACAFTV